MADEAPTSIPDYNNIRLSLEGLKEARPGIKISRPHLTKALDLIGDTPMVKLDKIAEKYGVKCNLMAKLEFMSLGGSVKDRIAKEMLLKAEADGLIKPGDYVIEATSGNTGIGLALVCAIRGYKMVVVMPEKMSAEKANVLTALGSKVVRTPTSAAFNDPDSHVSVAYRMVSGINARKGETGVGAIILDQYKNEGCVAAHYYNTAAEILSQTGGVVDALVATAGTGGTISGVGKKLKEALGTKVKIVGVDPEGSILHLQNPDLSKDVKSYEVEGIGYDFYPPVLLRDMVDRWEVTNDVESFEMARDLIQLEGLLVGGSSGSALAAAIRVAKEYPERANVVVILPDSIRNYLTKYVSDDWMLSHGMFDKVTRHTSHEGHRKEADLKSITSLLRIVSNDTTLSDLQRECESVGVINKNGMLISIMSGYEIALAALRGKNRPLSALANANSIMPVASDGELTSDLRTFFTAMDGEGKLREPVLLVMEGIEPGMSVKQRRAVVAQHRFSTSDDLRVVRLQDFAKHHQIED